MSKELLQRERSFIEVALNKADNEMDREYCRSQLDVVDHIDALLDTLAAQNHSGFSYSVMRHRIISLMYTALFGRVASSVPTEYELKLEDSGVLGDDMQYSTLVNSVFKDTTTGRLFYLDAINFEVVLERTCPYIGDFSQYTKARVVHDDSTKDFVAELNTCQTITMPFKHIKHSSIRVNCVKAQSANNAHHLEQSGLSVLSDGNVYVYHTIAASEYARYLDLCEQYKHASWEQPIATSY